MLCWESKSENCGIERGFYLPLKNQKELLYEAGHFLSLGAKIEEKLCMLHRSKNRSPHAYYLVNLPRVGPVSNLM